jgi:hypothetical protein
MWVIDWETREQSACSVRRDCPRGCSNADGNQGAPMHGIEVLPDRSAVWTSSRLDSRIYGWSLPDFEYIGAIEVGPTANWMTSTPDSRYMYVAVSGSDHTLAVDLRKGDRGEDHDRRRPARIDIAVLPAERVSDGGGR